MPFQRAWRAFKWSLLARRDRYPDFGIDRRLLRQEHFSPGQLRDLRRDKTRALVQACLDHVPYYGDLLRAAGIAPGRVEGPEDLERLPLLNKEIVRRERSRMLNRSARPEEYHPHTTAGSTGIGLDFLRGYDYERVAVAGANFRSWRRMGWRPGDPLGQFWMLHGDSLPETGRLGGLRRAVRRWLEPPVVMFDPFDNTPAALDRWVDRIEEQGLEYFYGYGAVVTLLGYHLQSRGRTLPRVRGLCSTAETLTASARKALAAGFPRATLIDIYGCREVPGVAAECARGSMHVNTDLVHVEFLRDPGAQGGWRLVLTALDNTLFPFIRYDIGDEGGPADRPCGCGLPFPVMRFGPGRVADSFVMPDGRILYYGPFEDLMFEVPGVHRYQFLQKTPGELIVLVVPGDRFDAESRAALERTRDKAIALCGPGVSVEVKVVEAIPLTRSGKHLYMVSLVKNPLLAAEGNQTAGLL
ncbi:MAG TPA: hypothetical protein VFQ07_01990 [Candidatus Polarisedimenticolia bacterium]|nr:hypothetical protein [Candidatus Polarisedimenticolia bacterium]